MAFSFQDGGGAPSAMPRAANRATGMDSFRAQRRLQVGAKNEAEATDARRLSRRIAPGVVVDHGMARCAAPGSRRAAPAQIERRYAGRRIHRSRRPA
ncbi:hypothetical protein [Burkholderia plantarii]|uniref:hypothetical protein n=1 Tax=Burkholderia plantarii TaxID=41899 RepID=UPI000F4E1650|nr:hypothetical protein [Burkholderia plantarii]WLE63349.1 hypothetical protein GIY62_23900 [Burkholderia plantarii]